MEMETQMETCLPNGNNLAFLHGARVVDFRICRAHPGDLAVDRIAAKRYWLTLIGAMRSAPTADL